MPRDLYESIRIFESDVAHSIAVAEGEEDEEYVPPVDLIALVTGTELSETKKTPDTRRLKEGKRYGFLTVGTGKGKVRGKQAHQCECECGGTVLLPRLEVLSRARMRAGCLGFDCPYGPPEVKAWHNPEFALWLQITTLLKTRPEEVDNRWGGRAYEGVGLVPVSEGVHAFITDALPLADVKNKRWWVTRKNYVLPYAEFNLEFESHPNKEVLSEPRRYVMYGDLLYSVDTIAGMFSIPVRTVKKWRRENESDSRVMELVMRETSE